ncbi:uncharacterized protein LOC112565819 [Pomacea canaliculata]|uniref:uncharacterized protein LOC112565819 n=1 Tax=Pomacea canaliculata TaxID=400727 RepID=UPI000D7269E9|nr:uncharacterized protein LOC112565819 [Pomacea canaliculata]
MLIMLSAFYQDVLDLRGKIKVKTCSRGITYTAAYSQDNSAMIYLLCTLVCAILVYVEAVLPQLPDCQRLEDHVLDSANPIDVFGANQEIGQRAVPVRNANLRSRGPIPTHHFATSQIKVKDRPEPLRIFPYEAHLDTAGVVYDAYTMERWYDPKRTDVMDQQSAWEAGRPWNKLNDMGTNLKQMVSGPDGNPLGVFTGKSGVRLGMAGSGEPIMTDFGDLYANFLFTGAGGTMEVPVVRGATLVTHIYKNANPVVKPYCLSSVAGHAAHFECPVEGSASDGGSGYLEGSCQGSTLKILLHNSKVLHDFSNVQWAASPSSNWNRAMHNCDAAHCRLTDGGKTVEITVPNANGEMSYAVNVIGKYVLPNDWGNAPQRAHCNRRRRGVADISLSATCSSDRRLTIQIDLADVTIKSVGQIQFAVESASLWTSQFVPGMHNCDASTCSQQGNRVTIHAQAPSADYKLAVNIISVTTLPLENWLQAPFHGKCDGSTVSSSGGTHVTSAPGNPTTRPGDTQPFALSSNTKFLLELDEPGGALSGQTRKFILYFSSPVRASVNSGTSEISFEPQSGGRYSGLVQLGYLGVGPKGDTSKSNALDQYHGIYSYKPTVSSCVSDSRAKAYLSFDWNPVDQNGHPTSRQLLMVTLPHQEYNMRSQFASNLRDSVFGFRTYEGNSWLQQYDVPHTPVDPDTAAVNRIKQNGAQLNDIISAIQRDAANVNLDAVCAHSDSYNAGKAIGMATRLASISRAFGTSHFRDLDTMIGQCLSKWLRVEDTLDNMWKFHYDTVWGGLFLRATNGDLDWGVDYGFPYYNDHHFHLGYFLYAMAYYVKYHPGWGADHKDRIYLVARDVGNPSWRDPHFPVVRHQDIYNGFSWASGLGPGERQEESASESINCYHALAALGDAFNDPYLKHAGQLHLAMEIASVREYWQVRAHNRNHFPPMLQKTGVVGQIAEGAWYVYTLDWPCDPNRFPMRHGCLVGIQVIPITAVSKHWVDQEWAGSIKEICEMAINPRLAADYSKVDPNDHDFRELTSGWQAFCYAAMAPLDEAHRTRAADYLRTKRPQDLVAGSGAASTLLFIYGST